VGKAKEKLMENIRRDETKEMNELRQERKRFAEKRNGETRRETGRLKLGYWKIR